LESMILLQITFCPLVTITTQMIIAMLHSWLSYPALAHPVNSGTVI